MLNREIDADVLPTSLAAEPCPGHRRVNGIPGTLAPAARNGPNECLGGIQELASSLSVLRLSARVLENTGCEPSNEVPRWSAQVSGWGFISANKQGSPHTSTKAVGTIFLSRSFIVQLLSTFHTIHKFTISIEHKSTPFQRRVPNLEPPTPRNVAIPEQEAVKRSSTG